MTAHHKCAFEPAWTLLLAALLSADVPGQDEPPSLEERWLTLREKLDAEPRSGQRYRLLSEFLRSDEASQKPSHRIVLKARFTLGAEALRTRRVDDAAAEFEEIRRRSDRDAPWGLDLFGFATIGLAQAAESAGRTLDARQLYREVKVRCPATRYADWAELGLARLQTKAPAVGEQLPELPLLRDRSDQTHRVRDLRGEPAILLFLSGPQEDSRRRTILSALRAEDIATNRLWTFTERALPISPEGPPAGDRVFPSQNGLLSDIALSCRIQATPTWLVLGPDGRLVARNPSPQRLRQILRTLKRERSR